MRHAFIFAAIYNTWRGTPSFVVLFTALGEVWSQNHTVLLLFGHSRNETVPGMLAPQMEMKRKLDFCKKQETQKDSYGPGRRRAAGGGPEF